MPPDQNSALRSVVSVSAVEERWEMSQSAKPILMSSTTATQERLGRTKDSGHSSTQLFFCSFNAGSQEIAQTPPKTPTL